MRMRAGKAMPACVLTLGLAVTGCASSTSSTPSAAATATVTISTQPAESAQAATASQTAAASTGSTTASSGSGSGSDCTVADLKIALGQTTGTGTGQVDQQVDMTNTGQSSCTMDGFPGVNLVGTADNNVGGTFSPLTWSLTRASVSYTPATLAPGQATHFDIMYLPWESSAASSSLEMKVTELVITPPNTTSQVTLPWFLNLLRQDMATHPGTFVEPVVNPSAS